MEKPTIVDGKIEIDDVSERESVDDEQMMLLRLLSFNGSKSSKSTLSSNFIRSSDVLLGIYKKVVETNVKLN